MTIENENIDNNEKEESNDTSSFNKSKKIINSDIRALTEQKYLDYAMSVIVDRALPDIRDGLKPVHRRILHAMNELSLYHNKPYAKSARIVGDVIGKYHPHGDVSVYDAKVRLAQPFSMRVMLIDGQGNYGSIDGDPAAAMRYTESRMSRYGGAMFKDIEYKTVNYRDNYDGTQSEPEVLPLTFPNLVINGVQGIAVGMASSIPPHNPIEALECVKRMVEDRMLGNEYVLEDLIKIMPAPDFPTGGILHGAKEMINAWTHGRASMKLRAKWHEEEVDGQAVIVIDQLPFQVNKANLHRKIVEVAEPNSDKTSLNFGKAIVEGIDDVKEESDKDGIRFCIYIKPEYDAELVFGQLMRHTQLEESVNYNATVLINGRPKVVGLLEMFDKFIDHRVEIITRRTEFLLKRASDRLHILDALMKAVHPDNVEKVISIIRKSSSAQEAKDGLSQYLALDDIQTTAILDMKLQKLTSMQLDDMTQEYDAARLLVAEYKDILANENRKYNIILEESDNQITEFANTKEKESAYGVVYPYRDRLTEFSNEVIKNDLAALTKEEECTIIYSANGYISRVAMDEFESQNRGTRGKKKMKLKKEDCIVMSINCHSHDSLMFISNKGKTYAVMAYDIPTGEKGRHINNILDGLNADEKIIEMLPIDFSKEDNSLIMITREGMIKRTRVTEYLSSRRKGGIIGINLNENDSIVYADICGNDEEVLMLNSNSMSIRFPISNIRTLSRNSKGVSGMNIDSDAYIIGGAVVKDDNGYMVCVSENGLVKITKMDQYRLQKRGGKGLRAMKSNERSGKLFSALYINDLNVDLVTTTKSGMNNRIALLNINVTSRNTTGVSLVKLESNDNLVSIFVVPHEEIEELDENIIESDEIINEEGLVSE